MADQFTPSNTDEQAWNDLALRTMESNSDVVAVVTMVVDGAGVIRPYVVTKNQPEDVGVNLRANITNVMVQLCTMLFRRAFRCGCKNCAKRDAETASQVKQTMPAPWHTTKAQA